MVFVFSLLFSPFFALFFLLLYLHRYKIKKIHVALSVFLVAFIGIYWYPWGDNQTHFAIYYLDIVNNYYSLALSSSHWLYDYVIYHIASLTGQYIWGYYFWLFVPFLFFSLLVWQIVDEQEVPNKEKWLLLILLILFLGIRELLDLNRNTNAGLFLAIATLLWQKNKALSITCVIVSLLLHDSIRYFIPFLPFGFILVKQSQRKTDLIIILTIIISGFLIKVIALLVVSERNAMYLEVGGGRGVGSGFMVLQGYVNILIGIIQYLIIRRNKSVIAKPLYVVYIVSILIAAALSSMWVGRERFLLVSNILATSIILTSWSKLRLVEGVKVLRNFQLIIGSYSMKIIINLLLVYSAHYVFNSATTDNQKEFSIVARSFYMPTFMLFDIENYGFSDKKFMNLYDRVDSTIDGE